MKKMLKLLVTITVAGILVVAGVLAAQTPPVHNTTVSVNFKTNNVAVEIVCSTHFASGSDFTMEASPSVTGSNLTSTLDNVDGTVVDNTTLSWSPSINLYSDSKDVILKFVINNKGSKDFTVKLGTLPANHTYLTVTSDKTAGSELSLSTNTLTVLVKLALKDTAKNSINDMTSATFGTVALSLTMTAKAS